MPTKNRYFLQSMANGIKALEIIADCSRPLSLTEIAKKLKANKATTTRICYTLSELGLIQRNNQYNFEITPNVLKFGYAAICSMRWRGVAKYYLEELNREIHQTINMAILDGPNVLFVLRIRDGDFFPIDIGVGAKQPAHCSSLGKVLLAFGLPEQTAAAIKQTTFRPLTVHSLAGKEELLEELEKIKTVGYAVNYEEVSIGVCGLAAPILNQQNVAIASISVAASTAQFNREELEAELAPAVSRCAVKISKALIQMESPKITLSENY